MKIDLFSDDFVAGMVTGGLIVLAITIAVSVGLSA